MKKKRAGRPLQWHPAFYAGVQIELAEDAENLVFENEHQLGTKPKEIDILIIKKDADVPVRKNIGRIFRKYNIIEYKSPTDSLLIDDFHRVYGYICFFKADTGTNDNIPIEDLTITFMCSKYPRKLMKHWQKNRHYEICQEEPGIYYIKGDVIPIQLLILPRLSEEENLWLSGLGKRIKETRTAEQLLSEYEKHKGDTLYRSVMDIIVKANAEKFQEVKEEMLCEALRELMKDEIEAQVKERVEAQVKEQVEAQVKKQVEAQVKEQVEAQVKAQLGEAETRGETKGLKALVDVLKGMSLDFDSAYQAIIETETYAKVSKKQVMAHWRHVGKCC